MQIVTNRQDQDRNNWMKAEIQTIKIKLQLLPESTICQVTEIDSEFAILSFSITNN